MKKLKYLTLTLIIPILFSGCSQKVKYFLPVSPEGVEIYEGGGCTAPGASYNFNVNEKIQGFISAGVGDDSWGLYYGFSIPKGETLRLLESNIKLSSKEWSDMYIAKMPNFSLSVYGGLPHRPKGYHKYYDPLNELSYTGLNEDTNISYKGADSFQSSVEVDTNIPKSFTLQFPKMSLSGETVQIPEVQFRYTEVNYILTCIQ